MSLHLKPLYIIPSMNSAQVQMILVDNRTSLNIISLTLITKVSRRKANMILLTVVI
jgi:hypothetical protein